MGAEEEWEDFNLKLDFLKLGMALHQLQEARGVVSHNWICLKKQPYHQLLLLLLGMEATQRRLLIKQLMLHMRLPKEFCHRIQRTRMIVLEQTAAMRVSSHKFEKVW